MQEGKTRWTHYCIASRFVWIPTYRRQILTGEGQQAAKELLTECGERHGLSLLAKVPDLDHVPVFVSAPPRFSPAQIAHLLKGYSSRYLRMRFPQLKKVCGKDHLWIQAYDAGTEGAVSAQVI